MKILSRPLLSALFASGMSGYLLAIFMAYLGLRLEGLGAMAIIIGIAFFSRNFFQIFLRVPFGELAQIVGRKPLITAGTGMYTIAFFLMYIANSSAVVLLATFVVAVGMALYWPAMFSYIGDISTDDYGKINGYIFQGSDIGVILGSLLAGYLLRNEIVDLSGLFGIGSLIGLLGVIIIYFTLSEVLDPSEQRHVESIPKALIQSFRDSLDGLVSMTKTKPLGRIYSFQFVISFVEYFFNSFFPLLVVLYMGYSDATVSDILFVTTIVIFFFKPYLGSISDKFGFRNPVLFALTINAISLAALTIPRAYIPGIQIFGIDLSSDQIFYIMVVVIYGIVISSSITSYLAVNGATSYAAKNSQRGLAMGALGFWVSFGRSSSSLVLTPIWSIYESITGSSGLAVRNIFLITSGIILIAVLILYFLSRNIEISQDK